MSETTTTTTTKRRGRAGKGSGKPPPPVVLSGSMIGNGGVGGEASMKKPGPRFSYSEEMADAVCAWLEQGRSLRSFCEQPNTPDRGTVYDWTNANPAFAARFAQARDRGIDALAELTLDDASLKRLPPDQIAGARLMFDARRWFCSKLKPGRYGDHVKAEVTGAVTVRSQAMVLLDILSDPAKLVERLPNLSDEQLQTLHDALPALLASPAQGEGEGPQGER
jgi:hypothetical protein